jgi:D-alanyl-lipoteichoic acid acyltransferase DltB (MBOAT superfamily)
MIVVLIFCPNLSADPITTKVNMFKTVKEFNVKTPSTARATSRHMPAHA